MVTKEANTIQVAGDSDACGLEKDIVRKEKRQASGMTDKHARPYPIAVTPGGRWIR